jgi:hypothetical protein
VLREGQQAVGQEVGGGLVAGEEEDSADRQHLLVGEEVTPLLGLHEGGDEVVPGVPTAVVDQGLKVLQELLEALLGTLPAVGLVGPDEEDAGGLVRPLLHLLPVLHGDTHVLRDNDDGQGEGEVPDELHMAPGLDPGQQGVDDLADPGPQPLHTEGGEGLVDQHAHPGVVGGSARNSHWGR